MKKIVWVLGDQLNQNSNLFKELDLNKDQVIILLIESCNFAGQHKHHKKKLIFQFSAMRHFAQELREHGFTVEYIDLKHSLSKLNFDEALPIIFKEHNASSLRLMRAADYEIQQLQQELKQQVNLKIEIVPNDLFLSDEKDLNDFFVNKKNYLMETYYRHLRKKHKILMEENGKPIGEQWNFDKENRKPLKEFSNKLFQHSPHYEPDQITLEVIQEVEKYFPDHYGNADNFSYAVTRQQALTHLEQFTKIALPHFGDYQDAMSVKHWHLFHSMLSYLINFGLLHPMEVVKAAQEKYLQDSSIKLNSVEGFIRQILGWREYIYAIYQTKMPEYKALNFFDYKSTLPEFMWTGNTQMNCLKHSVQQTIQHAYAHHIQRLMVIGNFCLLAGINPQEVCEWYLIVYIDALEWVELPNTLGMSQFADGGIVGTKPYVSSGKYINRMSDYCKSCHYDVNENLTENACPFNYLYWNFLNNNFEKLKKNPRMGIAMKNLLNKSPEELKQIQTLSTDFLASAELTGI
jgi:deoxyribodipyrimidine photolyase-related protein